MPRAVVVRAFGAEDVMVVEEVPPPPTPQPNTVVVRIACAGINPVDTYIRAGTYAAKPALP